MKKFLAYALVLGLASTRVCAQTGGSALDQLLKQSGNDAVPTVAATPAAAAAAADAGASAAKTELTLFSKCSGTFTRNVSIPLTLEFYKEHQAGRPEATTGNGVMNLTFSGGPAVPHALRIVSEDGLATKLELYTAFDSQRKFAEFAIPKTEKSQVRIFAIEFQADWVVMECVR